MMEKTNFVENKSFFQLKMESLLPPYCPIRITSGVDRYGFSNILAQRLKMRRVPRSFANWMHGWVWSNELTSENLMCKGLEDISIIVRNEVEQQALISEGFHNVSVGGLPFVYLPQQHAYRDENVLLAFPPHSTDGAVSNFNARNYFDYLASLKADFEDVYVSIYWCDLHRPIHKEALARGLKVIQGANPSDANGLVRMRSLLDGFKYVTSNNMGSHMLYALYSGCNFSFSGPMFGLNELDIMDMRSSSISYSEKYIQETIKVYSETYLRENFSRFFMQHPSMGVQDVEFAVDALGEKFILQPQEIKDALGWSIIGQINGYTQGAARRVIRSLR